MIVDALTLLAESISAFWIALAGGGFFKMIMIGCIIYWIFCRRRRRWGRYGRGWGCGRGRGCGCRWDPCDCGCPHCDCTCGGCGCGHGDHTHGHDQPGASGTDKEAATEG